MCSTQCDTPVIPACSLRAPTLYHTQKATTGAECTSLVNRVSPLGKECRSNVLWFMDVTSVFVVCPFVSGDGVFLGICTCVSVSLILYLSPAINIVGRLDLWLPRCPIKL